MLTAHFFLTAASCSVIFRWLLFYCPHLLSHKIPPVTANPTPNNGNAFDLTLTSLDSSKPDDEIPFEALKTFVDVFDTVKGNYIENHQQ